MKFLLFLFLLSTTSMSYSQNVCDILNSGHLKATTNFILKETGEESLEEAIMQFAERLKLEKLKFNEADLIHVRQELEEAGLLKKDIPQLSRIQFCLESKGSDFQDEVQLVKLIGITGDLSPGVIGEMITASYSSEDLADESRKSLLMVLEVFSILQKGKNN